MDVKKIFLKQVLEETLKQYSNMIIPIQNVELNFISTEDFLSSVKEDKLIQMQIQAGLYKNLEKEYPNFLVVYHRDKNPLIDLFGGNYKITICDEIAKDRLKPFNKQEVRDYLTHGFSHEITHILENKLKDKFSDMWEKCLTDCNNNEELAHEQLAEDIADIVVPTDNYRKIEDKLFAQVNQNIKKFRQMRNLG